MENEKKEVVSNKEKPSKRIDTRQSIYVTGNAYENIRGSLNFISQFTGSKSERNYISHLISKIDSGFYDGRIRPEVKNVRKKIAIPKEEHDILKRKAKEQGYSSISEYFILVSNYENRQIKKLKEELENATDSEKIKLINEFLAE